jgi:hypothetical protein
MTSLRYFFEYGVDTVLWPDSVDSPLGYPCDTPRLPITDATGAEIYRLARHYQSSLDWDDPAGPTPWTREQCDVFNVEARQLLNRLRAELPADWAVEDRFRPL